MPPSCPRLLAGVSQQLVPPSGAPFCSPSSCSPCCWAGAGWPPPPQGPSHCPGGGLATLRERDCCCCPASSSFPISMVDEGGCLCFCEEEPGWLIGIPCPAAGQAQAQMQPGCWLYQPPPASPSLTADLPGPEASASDWPGLASSGFPSRSFCLSHVPPPAAASAHLKLLPREASKHPGTSSFTLLLAASPRQHQRARRPPPAAIDSCAARRWWSWKTLRPRRRLPPRSPATRR